ncbi:hypothetical protein F2Q69_00052482 [Brassica cretica]|uniref:Uncharacterized protein n=1 Tax=Brassica cretica TaxID=69181 RepID=A0A8S9MZT2_BRACR|nr:hypothetical protein F2Q69_00052482 [Brassica cretica]
MSKIYVARLNALRPKPKPSEHPPEPVRTPSDDGEDSMEEDRVSTGRTLRGKKEKVAKHLKRGANDKEKKSFCKKVFRIPIDKSFEDAYYTHKLWMFLDIKLNWNSSLLLGRAFLSTVGAVCNLQTNQLCLTLIDPNAHYDPIPVRSHRRSLEESMIQESLQLATVEPNEWENDYYNPTIDAYTKQNMHTDEYDKDNEEERATENAPSIDMTSWPSIDTQPQQRCRKRASIDTAYYKSVDTDVNRAREGDYSIGSWADEHHHESFAVETATYTLEADKLQDSFTDEELLNMQRRDDTDQIQAEAAWERTHFSQSIETRHQQSIDTCRQQSIDIKNTTSIDNRPIPRDPDGYAKAIDGRTLHVFREDIAYIVQTANGADNLFMHQRSIPEQKTTKEFYGTTGGIENCFKQRSRHTTHPSIDVDFPTITRQLEFGRRAYDLYGNRKFYWEEKDEYGVYRDDRDELAYICLPEHASSFTQTKLVPEIYTKNEINVMFYGVYGDHERNKEAFQMKFDGVYYPLNDSISWLTTCMEEMKQDIARIQNATDTTRPPSIDKHQPQSIDSRQPPSIDRHHHTSIDNRLTASIDNNPPRLLDPDFVTKSLPLFSVWILPNIESKMFSYKSPKISARNKRKGKSKQG